MSITILEQGDPRYPKGGPNPEEDRLARQKRAHTAKIDEKEEFIKEEVTISTGPKNDANKVTLRYPRSAYIKQTLDDLDNVVKRERIWTNGRFVFAVYSDNPGWHKAARDEWEAGARQAIEKFTAVRGNTIIAGPRQEDTNRFNIMCELRESVKT